MRLSSVPGLPQNLIALLDTQGIKTDADFLSKKPMEILLLAPKGISLAQINEYKDIIAAHCSAPGIHARNLLQTLEHDPYIYDLDLPDNMTDLAPIIAPHSGNILEITGDKQNKKSEFLLNIALRYLAKNTNRTVYWIDTTGEFSPETASCIASSITQDESTCLDQMQFSLALEIEEMYDIFDNITSFMMSPDGDISKTVGYVIIDNITSLLGPLLGGSSSQGHAVMTNLMRQLRTISQNYSTTVMVVNHSASNTSNPQRHIYREPSLGPTFTFLTDTTLLISKASVDENTSDSKVRGDSELYHVQVVKSNSMAANTLGTYALDSECIRMPI